VLEMVAATIVIQGNLTYFQNLNDTNIRCIYEAVSTPTQSRKNLE